jgi:hypothetical protein
MTPLGKVAGNGSKKWVMYVSIYTAAGWISSTFVGLTTSFVGLSLFQTSTGTAGVYCALIVALLASAREFGLVSIPLPQVRRQTKRIWATIFPTPITAALWGLDLGLVFSTWLTYSGAWLLLIVAIVSQDPVFGAALFAAYWFGRVLSVWIAPLLLQDAASTAQLLRGLMRQREALGVVHAWGIVWATVVLGMLLLNGLSL